jgi:hypothetical protein
MGRFLYSVGESICAFTIFRALLLLFQLLFLENFYSKNPETQQIITKSRTNKMQNNKEAGM